MRKLIILTIAALLTACAAKTPAPLANEGYSYIYDVDNTVGIAMPNSFSADLKSSLEKFYASPVAIAKGTALTGSIVFPSPTNPLLHELDMQMRLESLYDKPAFKRLISDNTIYIQGYKARQFVYEMETSGIPLTYHTTIIPVKDVMYSITSYAYTEVFGKYIDRFEYIAESIKIKSTSKTLYNNTKTFKADFPVYYKQTEDDDTPQAIVTSSNDMLYASITPIEADSDLSIEEANGNYEQEFKSSIIKIQDIDAGRKFICFEDDIIFIMMFSKVDKQIYLSSMFMTVDLSQNISLETLLQYIDPAFDIMVNTFEVIK